MSFKKWFTEAAKKEPTVEQAPIVITFGRMNPPTSGHGVLVQKILDLAKEYDADHQIFLSHSHDPEKNPLSYKDKIKFAKAYWPHAHFMETDQVKDAHAMLRFINSKGYKEVIMVVGSDRINKFKDVEKYIGPDKPYQFHSFKLVTAGADRDEAADDVSGMSASKMRALAKADKYKEFLNGTPNAKLANVGKQMYDKVREGMNIKSSKK